MCVPTVSLADTSGLKSGLCAESTGVGTATEKCYMYHRNAIGHAFDKSGLATPVGYDQEQDYSWARASAYMGCKLLQSAGDVVVTHDGSAYA